MKYKNPGCTADIIIERKGSILLVKRKHEPFKDMWALPGGYLEYGEETIEQTCIRETKEETDIDIRNPQVISIHNCKNEHAHFMTAGLIAHEWAGEAKVMEPDEIIKWEWFDLNNLPSPRYFPSFEVIENYTKGQFYIKRK